MMITGGVDADNSPFTFLCFSKTPAFSPSQKIRPFDQESDGMLIGEGLGMIVLKRLEDAERDGDRIYAIIRGIGSSSDGKYKSIYAPRPSGQSLAIKRAYQEAGFAPDAVSLVEAHGTGTKAGDPAEFNGLKAVFGTPNGNKQSIAIGSVKSQIGHTKAAAGAAGMIKTALALHHKVLPPTLNVEQPSRPSKLKILIFISIPKLVPGSKEVMVKHGKLLSAHLALAERTSMLFLKNIILLHNLISGCNQFPNQS